MKLGETGKMIDTWINLSVHRRLGRPAGDHGVWPDEWLHGQPTEGRLEPNELDDAQCTSRWT